MLSGGCVERVGSVEEARATPWPAWLLDCVLWKPASVVRQTRHAPAAGHSDQAIEGIVRAVSAAGEGERNRVRFWGGSRLGERMRAGQIGQGEATAVSIAAARATGLHEIGTRRTISSAWRAAP
jgi:hypothetical protein